MANNFLSTPFASWVKEQVNVRQKALGKYSDIPSQDLQYFTNKTPFLRVASSVNLTNQGTNDVEIEDSVLNKLLQAGYSMDDIGGNQLARNFILQGGAVSSNPNDETFSGLQSGLNDGSSIFNGAYGWGGSEERGYVPMPGITQADVTYYNNGALSKTVINVKCYSKAQFQLFDTLYLRPGYTLLMEFGWSQYLDNKGNLQNFPNFYTGPMSRLLGEEKVNQYQLYKSIEDERELHNGNYDAVFGKISKFNWQFLPDGSYDCQIQLTAIGDVIESLKCNIVDAKSLKGQDLTFWESLWEAEGGDPTEPPLISNARVTIINAQLFKIYQQNKSSGKKPSLQTYKIEGFQDESGKITTKEYKKALLVIPGTTTDDENSQSPQIYIKYGAFLAYLQSKILVYDTSTVTPLFTFAIDFDNIDEDDNVILTIPGQISSDPRVCLIPYNSSNIEGVPEYTEYDINTILKETAFKYKNEVYLGRFTNIMVNINYIAETLKQTTPEDGDIKLLDFLKKLNAGIIEATGGINKYEYKLSDSGLSVKIIEDIPQRFEELPFGVDFTRFNVYGVKPGVEGSFIRNINLTADLSNNFATMISIGAQSNSNQASGNATSFSNYNAGLKDRIIEEKLSSPSIDSEGEEKEKVKEIIWSDPDYLNSSMESIYGNFKWIEENISSFKTNNKQNTSLMLGFLTDATAEKQAQLQAPFFLPFNLSLEMDGLSGMKLYQKFLMTDDILPASYENDGVDLQLTGINHSISKEAWITKLETISVPAEKLGAPTRPKQSRSAASRQVYSTTTSENLPQESLTETPPPVNPESPTRREAMQTSYTGVFRRDGQVSGMCARWSLNLALGYVDSLKGRVLSSTQIAAGGNANNNDEYYNNLTKLGYTKTTSIGLSKAKVLSLIKTTTWGYGDVIAYWANDGNPTSSHKKYGHTQIYVGNINSSKWSTSKKTNYNTDFPYRSRPSNNWNYVVFRAPAS
mgnify:CR=1 FL=1